MIGTKETRWKCNGMRMKNWRRFWNEEEWMEVPSRQKTMEKVPELVVLERVPRQTSERVRREEKSERMVHRRDEEQTKQFLGGRHGRNDRVEIHESEEMDQCWEKLAKKMEEEQKRNTQRQRLSVGMEACVKKQEYESGEKITGQGFSLCSENRNLQPLQSMLERSTEGLQEGWEDTMQK